VQKASGPFLTICTSYDVLLVKEMPFGGFDDCTWVKNLVALF